MMLMQRKQQLEILNNVVRAGDISIEEDAVFRTKDDSITIFSDNPMYSLPKGILRAKEEYENDEDIKSLLEEKYKFKNDETSTRFKVAREERTGFPVFPENHDERHIAWAFRSYAVRRIVGGMETSISMYPYNVAISRNAKHWCGGSIIDEQWVLTAGHCLESAFDGDKRKLQPFIIRAGSSFHNRGGYQARVNKVFFPHEYVPGNADFDYSLIRLDRPMPIGRNIAVLNLPSKDYLMKENDILIVTGWGSTDESGYGHIPDRVRFVPVPVMRLEDCQKSYRFYITPRMLCAGYATGGKDACNKARQREKELQKFKARVEDKKNKIKTWLRETLKSPTFIELAKKKLKEAGFHTRRTNDYSALNVSNIDDKMIDEINLTNMINDRIIEDGDGTESDKLLRTLALHEVMLNDHSSEIFPQRAHDDGSDSVESFIAYISGN
ncbi:unnamed protein product [Chrysodeixis includens]|uniref:Peptidase S1 domain-containing protein n=1 Tax=Chrysodeixis includens TaxID=689277 RepID=A0A9N8Q0H7_CHRIL|nr:unnamed protein product [Chrysodeixis includens]